MPLCWREMPEYGWGEEERKGRREERGKRKRKKTDERAGRGRKIRSGEESGKIRPRGRQQKKEEGGKEAASDVSLWCGQQNEG